MGGVTCRQNLSPTKSFPSHDVGLVDGCDLAPPLLGGIVKSKLGDALRLGTSDNFQALNHTLDALENKKSDTRKEDRNEGSLPPLLLPNPAFGTSPRVPKSYTRLLSAHE